MSANSKVIDRADLVTLASTIKTQHTQINQLKDDFETNKEALSTASKNLFIEDISKAVPEYTGNHEYHTAEGTVTVNFKVTGKAPKEINSRPSAEIIREKFGADTDSLFEIQNSVTITADDTRLRAQACEHPELFQISLKPLTHAQMMQLVVEHPDYLTVSVVDPTQYATVYPGFVTTSPVATFKTGFIEAIGKIDEVVKKNAKGLLKAILPAVIQTAVNCGNRSKKK